MVAISRDISKRDLGQLPHNPLILFGFSSSLAYP